MFTRKHARNRRRAFLIASVLALAVTVILVASGLAGAASHNRKSTKPTIVLVHGDWADASSWTSVLERLQDKGFTVVAPANPLRGPAEDSANLASFLATISGPIVLVAGIRVW